MTQEDALDINQVTDYLDSLLVDEKDTHYTKEERERHNYLINKAIKIILST